jgi:hypothetical protein
LPDVDALEHHCLAAAGGKGGREARAASDAAAGAPTVNRADRRPFARCTFRYQVHAASIIGSWLPKGGAGGLRRYGFFPARPLRTVGVDRFQAAHGEDA